MTDGPPGRPSRRRPSPLVRLLLRAPAPLYRWRLGGVLGGRFLLLTHAGRRSGRLYRTPLEVLGPGSLPDEVLVLAGFGRDSDWVRNVRAGHAVEVAIGRRRFVPVWRELDERAAADALAAYERRNRWIAPVVRRMLGRLAGWRYDGGPESRRRLVRRLPVLGFRPAGEG